MRAVEILVRLVDVVNSSSPCTRARAVDRNRTGVFCVEGRGSATEPLRRGLLGRDPFERKATPIRDGQDLVVRRSRLQARRFAP